MLLQDAFSVGNNGVQPEANDQVVQTADTEDQESSSPWPSEKEYPHLTAVKDMFWDTFENINQASVYGKLDIRAARNTMRNVLGYEEFWSLLAKMMRNRVYVTHFKKKADSKIQKCNMFTSAITSPIATQALENVANEFYATVSSMRPDVASNAMRLVTDMVNGGRVTRGLDAIADTVTRVNLCPEKLIKGFDHIHDMLKMGGTMKMNGGMAKGLMSVTSNFK